MFYLNRTIKNIAFIFGVVALSLGLGYAALAIWQEPSITPPAGNVDAPVNVGMTDQFKDGSLSLNLGGISSMGLFVNRDAFFMNGKIGIGTLDPDPTGSGTKMTIVPDPGTQDALRLASDYYTTFTIRAATQIDPLTGLPVDPYRGPAILGERSRGTRAAPLASQDMDTLLEMYGIGYYGSGLSDDNGAGAINIGVDGIPNLAEKRVPGRVVISTTSSSSSEPNQIMPRMTINNQGNVGIGTMGPEFKLSLDNDGGILAKGIFGSGAALPTTGSGPRLIWYPKKAAFRAGMADTQWDDANIGNYSFASGIYTTASGEGSTALGWQSTASGQSSTAIGGSRAISAGDIAIGGNNTASGGGSIAMGVNTVSTGLQSIAIGIASEASGRSATAIGGQDAHANGMGSMALGSAVQASAVNSMAIGWGLSNVNYMVNNIPSSLGIGFNSDVPTLFVGSSAGAGTTGNVGIGTTTPGQKLEVNGGIKLNTATARPACAAATRGVFWVVQGSAGVKDSIAVCAKDAVDAYAWRILY